MRPDEIARERAELFHGIALYAGAWRLSTWDRDWTNNPTSDILNRIDGSIWFRVERLDRTYSMEDVFVFFPLRPEDV